MNQNNQSGASRSRARGNSHTARGSRPSNNRSTSAERGTRTYSHSGGRGASGHNVPGHQSGRYSANRKKKNTGNGFVRIAVGGVILIVGVTVVAGIMKGISGSSPVGAETETQTETAVPETEILTTVVVDGIDITGLSREEAKAAIEGKYAWGMTVTYNDQTYQVNNLISGRIDMLLGEIFSGVPDEKYTLDTDGLEEAAAGEAAAVAVQWNRKAKNASISEYDASTDKFLFTGGETGLEVDQEKLASDILSAVAKKDFDASITAAVNTLQPELSENTAREKYKTIATFTTKTTANSKRNTNVKLACQAVNGTVLHPGEEFSFNGVVGQRTEAKGYKPAGAYSNGEVVEEIGGGVCQVSSTLYNAVLKAGLKTTTRRSHTFEPSYVTPGTDATISWGGPDYKFVNNSSTSIGIRASYSDRTCTVSIYGVPILEEGVTYSLKSTKTKDYMAGTEAERLSGLQSTWETRLVIKKDGEVVSQDIDHRTTYKSHTDENDAAEAAAIAAAESLAAMMATSVPETIEPQSESAMESGGGTMEGGNIGPNVPAGPGADSETPRASSGVVSGPGSSASTPGTSSAPAIPQTSAPSPSGQVPSTGATAAPISEMPAPSVPGTPAPSAPAPDTAPAVPVPTMETIAPMPGSGL